MFSTAQLDILAGFERDANTLLVGPTSSGKTSLLRKIIQEGKFVGGTPNRLYVVVPPETAQDWKDYKYPIKTEYIIGDEELDGFLQHGNECPENSIVVFDDLMTSLDHAARRKELERWFSVTTHHRHLWTFFVTHDMFHKQLTTIRRNVQNFILFNVLQSDFRAANEFAQRLLGTATGSAFVSLWQAAVEDTEKGWIRLDQKIHRDAVLKTIVSTGGLSVKDGIAFACRSDSLDSPLMLDSMAMVGANKNPAFEIPEGLVARIDGRHGSTTRRETSPASVSDDGPSDLQQSD